jgi:hypothetical protein
MGDLDRTTLGFVFACLGFGRITDARSRGRFLGELLLAKWGENLAARWRAQERLQATREVPVDA